MLRTTTTLTLTAGLATTLLLTGCGLDTTDGRAVVVQQAWAAPSAPATSQPAGPATAGQPTRRPTAAPTARPTTPPTTRPTTRPTTPHTTRPTTPPARPAPTYDVAAVQRRLTALRYYVAAVDGRPGPAMRSAVMAFQKVNGLSADGVVGPRTLAALAAPRTPVLRHRSPADRVEVDLDRQVLHVVRGGARVRTVPVSSGNGETYRQRDGSTARALTPVGTYRIERRIVGERHADLGTLYDPQYFYRGWAIHGSNSVPAVPASHGCVRVTRADATYLLGVVGVGTTVHLYGGQHVFEAGSRAAGTSAPTGDPNGGKRG